MLSINSKVFFGVLIAFLDLFLISDNPGGCELQISITSRGQNMKSIKKSHVRYQIIGFWCSDSILGPIFDLR